MLVDVTFLHTCTSTQCYVDVGVLHGFTSTQCHVDVTFLHACTSTQRALAHLRRWRTALAQPSMLDSGIDSISGSIATTCQSETWRPNARWKKRLLKLFVDWCRNWSLKKWHNVRRFGTWMSKTHGCVNPCYHVDRDLQGHRTMRPFICYAEWVIHVVFRTGHSCQSILV